jgi:hypothetical protein
VFVDKQRHGQPVIIAPNKPASRGSETLAGPQHIPSDRTRQLLTSGPNAVLVFSFQDLAAGG